MGIQIQYNTNRNTKYKIEMQIQRCKKGGAQFEMGTWWGQVDKQIDQGGGI